MQAEFLKKFSKALDDLKVKSSIIIMWGQTVKICFRPSHCCFKE